MATIKPVLDRRNQKKDGSYPLKLNISYKGRSSLISLNIDLHETQWDDDLQRVINHPRKESVTSYIGHLVLDSQEFVLEARKNGTMSRYRTATELKNAIQEHIFDQETDEPDNRFMHYLLNYGNTRKTEGSRVSYRSTYNRINEVIANADSLTFEDINKRWLERLDNLLEATGTPSVNGRNSHFRNIRAVMNDAIDNDITANYPFRKFKIKQEPTKKRSLSVESLRTLFNFPVDEHQEMYLDVFKLSFFLIGINMVDLLHATKIEGDRLVYNRQKTNKPYSIKIEPEAMEIINKYRGKRFVLNFMDTRTSYRQFNKQTNQALQSIGYIYETREKKSGEPLFPDLTTYWARHSWASIAYSIGVSKDVISQALGHSSGLSVTEIYIDKDTALVDKANRAVIDWVLYKKKSE